MIKIVDSQIDLTCLEMADVIDQGTLQDFLDNFAVGFHCAAVSVGRKGEEFTRPSHYRPFCSNFIHATTIGDERCAECHHEFGQRAVEQGKPYIGHCHAGLVDFAAPVIVRGEHVGTVLGGQILDGPYDEKQMRAVAGEIGVDSDALCDAAAKIDVVPQNTVEAASAVLSIVTNALAAAGLARIETNMLCSQLADKFLQISGTVGNLANDSQDITNQQEQLSGEIAGVNEQVQKIAEILGSISKIADQIKILGINASIEAARLGSAGRSFAVVADEVRSLSETAKKTVSTIHGINKDINLSINATMEHSAETMNTTSKQTASMEELSSTVQETVAVAEKLKELF